MPARRGMSNAAAKSVKNEGHSVGNSFLKINTNTSANLFPISAVKNKQNTRTESKRHCGARSVCGSLDELDAEGSKNGEEV